jgi:oxygen-independent coproporphyrinogen-3 oxidase
VAHHTALNVLNQRPLLNAGGVLANLAHPVSVASSLYIHVPFCFHKCHYCDFYSIVDQQDRQSPYIERLKSELAALGRYSAPLQTIFIGGGTPTLLRIELWQQLLQALGNSFDLSQSPEFTVECNPETATPELFSLLCDGGVNRISIGAQSFNPVHLKTLERWHDPQNVLRAIALAREAGISRQSMDLIHAIPGQTLAEWESDLKTAISAGTTHLSCYALTYEPGTAMTARLNRGEFPRADEDLEADMFALTLSTLRSAGLKRYEVSNFATPGDECRHNLAYWRQENWLAAGPSASAHMQGHRWKNLPRLDDYLNRPTKDFASITDYEAADSTRNLAERIMTGLRISEGLDASLLSSHPAAARVFASAKPFSDQGLLMMTDGRWMLTDAGFMIADTIAAKLMAALD